MTQHGALQRACSSGRCFSSVSLSRRESESGGQAAQCFLCRLSARFGEAHRIVARLGRVLSTRCEKADRDRYLCVACRPHTRPQRFSPRRRELARAPQTHHTHRKPRHPTLASRSKRKCAPLQHAAHMTQAMSSFTSTHHVASNAHKAPRNAPGTLSRPSRAHSNAPIPAQ